MFEVDEQWLIANGLYDIADPSDLYDQIVKRRERGDDGIKPPVSKLEGCFSLPLRGITILGAYSGTGKSTFASQWALHAANCGRKVALMSLEMPPDFTLELLAEQSAAVAEPHLPYVERFAQWANGKIYLHSGTDVVTPEKVYQFVEVAKMNLGAELVVIDPLMQIALPSEPDAERDFITRLASMSRDYEIAILLVHHLRKPPAGGLGERQKPDKSSFLGSTHLTGAAAAVITLWADPDLREMRTNGIEIPEDAGPDYLFTVHKQRFAAWHGTVGLWAHSKARLLTNSKARMYRAINLEDECTQTPTQPSIELVAVNEHAGSSEKKMPESSPETDSTTVTDPFLSWRG